MSTRTGNTSALVAGSVTWHNYNMNKEIIENLCASAGEFHRYMDAAHPRTSILSAYCLTRALMAACDMAYWADKLKSETIRDKV